MKKRLISLLAAAALLVAAIPAPALAEEGTVLAPAVSVTQPEETPVEPADEPAAEPENEPADEPADEQAEEPAAPADQPAAEMTTAPAAELLSTSEDQTEGIASAEQLQAAVNAAADGVQTTITLTGNVDGGVLAPVKDGSVLTVVTIPADKNIVLDLAGFTISAELQTNGSTYGLAQVIRNEGTLTIKDSSENQSGKIYNTGDGSKTNGCTATIRNEGQDSKLTVESGEIASAGGNAIRNQNGLLTINGGKITTTGAFASFDNGTAAIHNRGDAVINGGDFSTEYQAPVWYGAGADNSTTVITGGTFTSVNSGVDIQGNSGTVEVKGGRFHVDPTDFVAPGFYVNEENSYYVVESAGSSVTVTTFEQLKNVLESSSGTLNITVSGNVAVTEDIVVPASAWLFIDEGAVLSVQDATLTLNGFLLNRGTLDVSKIGSGFISNLNRYSVEGGAISGLPEATNGTYEISTAAQLQMMHFVMMANADENGVFHGNITLVNDIDLQGYKFLPLGYDFVTAFSGTFDGNGHKINNLTIDLAAGAIGLFSVTENADFVDLTVANASLNTQSGVMGTLAGKLYGSSNFVNVTVSGTYNNAASYYCGGWIGYMGGADGSAHNFVNCHNEMDVTGCYNVGSFWGSSSGSKAYITMINCSNSGDVTATGGTIGVIGGFAYNDAILYNFTNTGKAILKGVEKEDATLFTNKNPENVAMENIVAVRYGANGRAVPYDSLLTALDNAAEGDEVLMLADVKLDSMLSLNNEGVTLDLGGHVLTSSENFKSTYENDSHVLNVQAANVTVKNGTIRTTAANKHGVNLYWTTGTVLEDLIIDHTTAATGAPLVVNGTAVTVQGKLETIMGENSWYAVNVATTNTEYSASFTLGQGADMIISGVKPIYNMGIAAGGSDETTITVAFEEGCSLTSTVEGIELIAAGKGTEVKNPENVGLQPDGDGSFSPIPAPTPKPTAEPWTPNPTPTPTPAPAPTATPKPLATARPVATPTPQPTTAPVVSGETVVTTTAEAVVENATATVTLSSEQLTETVNQAVAQAKEEGAAPVVKVEVTASEEAQAVQVALPADAVATLAAEEVAALTVTSSVATVTFDTTALAAIAEQAETEVVLVVSPVAPAELNEAQAASVGEEPVVELTLRSGDTVISDFSAGSATVTVPYTLAEGRQAEGVVVWYLDEAGATTPCETSYDEAAGLVTFTTPHFSKYVIGYDESLLPAAPEVEQPAVSEPTSTEAEGGLPVLPIAIGGIALVLLILVLVLRKMLAGKNEDERGY